MKIRAIVLVFLTLVLGFILGILVSAQIRYYRLKPVRIFFSGERFREGLYQILEPDEKQTAEINQILSRYAKASNSVMTDFRRKSDSLIKEFWKEIEPRLTKEQIDRLKELENKRMRMIRQTPEDSGRFRPRHKMPYGGPPPDRLNPRVKRPFRGDSIDHSRM